MRGEFEIFGGIERKRRILRLGLAAMLSSMILICGAEECEVVFFSWFGEDVYRVMRNEMYF